MYIVNRTLQSRDANGNKVFYTASSNPQKLPADLAKEAVARGWATKVAKKAAKAEAQEVTADNGSETTDTED